MLDDWVNVGWEGTGDDAGGEKWVWGWVYVGGPARTTKKHFVVEFKRR